MEGIAVSTAMFLLKGIPEGFLVAWGMHILTDTPLHKKPYLLLSLFYIVITYLIRFLPITLGVNTVLSLFVLIFCYQIVYHANMTKMVHAMIASVVILVMTALSEILNVVLLTLIYGSQQASQLVTSSNQINQALYTIPSTVFLGLITLAGYYIAKAMKKRKQANGKNSETTGE